MLGEYKRQSFWARLTAKKREEKFVKAKNKQQKTDWENYKLNSTGKCKSNLFCQQTSLLFSSQKWKWIKNKKKNSNIFTDTEFENTVGNEKTCKWQV